MAKAKQERGVVVTFLKKDVLPVFAFFPYENYNVDIYGENLKISYEHLGQHSSCSLEHARECELAEEFEYEELKNELEKVIGYTLIVKQKKTF